MTEAEFDAVLGTEVGDVKYFIPVGVITTPLRHVTNHVTGAEGVRVSHDANFIYVAVPTGSTFDAAAAGATAV